MMKDRPSQGIPHGRVEALSDLVFGLALSIGAIVLVTQTAPTTTSQVTSSVIEFGFSFLVLIRVWTRYTTIMTDLPVDTGYTRNMNLFLLFLVAVEPYLFYLLYGSLATSPTIVLSTDFTTAIYALDLAGLFLVLGIMTYLLAHAEKTRHVPELVRRFQFSGHTQVVAGALLLLSSLAVFWQTDALGEPLRYWIWGGALLIGSVQRAYFSHHPMTPEGTAPPPLHGEEPGPTNPT